jgi:hypothetical protein
MEDLVTPQVAAARPYFERSVVQAALHERNIDNVSHRPARAVRVDEIAMR